MTSLSTVRQHLQTNASVHKADLRAAIREVEKSGVTLDEVQALADAFEGASKLGRVPAEVREMFAAALPKLIKKAPAAADPLLTRLDEGQLRTRLSKLQKTITAQGAEIESLEATIRSTTRQVEQKARKASDLVDRKQKLQRALREKKEAERNTMILMFLGAAATGGAASGILSGLGLNSAMSIGDINRELRSVERDIANAQSEKRQLDRALSQHKSRQSKMRTQVDALQSVEKALRKTIKDLPDEADLSTMNDAERVASLAQSVQSHQTLSANLAKQIRVLKGMQSSAQGFSRGLDSLIKGLEAEIESLEERIVQTDRAILSNLFDFIVGQTGMDPNLRVGDFTFSKKMLLLDGVAGLKASLFRQAEKMFDDMVGAQLLSATGSKRIAKRLLALIKGDTDIDGVRETVKDVLTERVMASLTEPQLYAVDLVLGNRDLAADAQKLMVETIVNNGALSDAQARALAGMMAGELSTDEVVRVLARDALSPTAAALELLVLGGNVSARSLVEGGASEAFLRDGAASHEVATARSLLSTGAESSREIAAQQLVGWLTSTKAEAASFVDEPEARALDAMALFRQIIPRLPARAAKRLALGATEAETTPLGNRERCRLLLSAAHDAAGMLAELSSLSEVKGALEGAAQDRPRDATVRAASLAPGAIDHDAMVSFIETATKDSDGQAAKTEYEDLFQIVGARWADCSPRARAAFREYSGEALAGREGDGVTDGWLDRIRAQPPTKTEDGSRAYALVHEGDFDRLVMALEGGISAAGFADLVAADPKVDELAGAALEVAKRHFAGGGLDEAGFDKMLREVRASPYKDRSIAAAFEGFRTNRKKITAAEFIDAVIEGTSDKDAQGASRDFFDIQGFVERHPGRLTVGAQRAFAVLAKAAKAQRDAGETGMDIDPLRDPMLQMGFRDEGMAKALAPLLDHNRKISGTEMMKVIDQGASDNDGHARDKELEDVLEFASLVDKRLSPAARKVVAAYEGWTEMDTDWDDLLAKMGAVA